MSRLKARFDELAAEGRKALVPFITAGDPNPMFTVPLMHEMTKAGADVIELGVPFSDPMADGPVIQRASERALEHRVGLRTVLAMVSEFRKNDQLTPIVLMGYLNPIEIMGYEKFADASQQAEVDGVITVDLPPEEAEECVAVLNARGIDQVFLSAPNSSSERIKKISAVGGGYLYYVSVKGITGSGHLNVKDVEQKLAQIRKNTKLPISVGFGIKNAEMAKKIASLADGVVVGSAFISKIEDNLDNPERAKQEIIELIKSMRQAMDS
ncbi:MAG: tryptophan synthase subunit alpha [Methylococcales bacterium]|nr:tryptophan synthase subunit alpha [Methylococcales bacterium]